MFILKRLRLEKYSTFWLLLFLLLNCTRSNSSNKPIIEYDGPFPSPTLADEQDFTKLSVSEIDSSMWLHADMIRDHQIFGYQRSNIASQKMLLLSVFTYSVENNPYKCRYGAYYQSTDMNGMKLKIVKIEEHFVEAILITDKGKAKTIYFEKAWIKWVP